MSAPNDDVVGMDYRQSLPRRWVTTYIPIGLFVFVLLFPVLLDGDHLVQAERELLSREGNPFWVIEPTLAHFKS